MRKKTNGGQKDTTWPANTSFRLSPAWRPLPGERLDGDGESTAPYLTRVRKRRDELFAKHPPPRNKGGYWACVLLEVASEASAKPTEQVELTVEALQAQTRLPHLKTLLEALQLYVTHGLIVAEEAPTIQKQQNEADERDGTTTA